MAILYQQPRTRESKSKTSLFLKFSRSFALKQSAPGPYQGAEGGIELREWLAELSLFQHGDLRPAEGGFGEFAGGEAPDFARWFSRIVFAAFCIAGNPVRVSWLA